MKTNARDRLKKLIEDLYILSSESKISWTKVEKQRTRMTMFLDYKVISAFELQSPKLFIGYCEQRNDPQTDKRLSFISFPDQETMGGDTFFDYELYSPLEKNTLSDLVGLVRIDPKEIDFIIESIHALYD